MTSVGTVGVVRTAEGFRVSALGIFAYDLCNIPFFTVYSLFIYIAWLIYRKDCITEAALESRQIIG